MTPEDQVCVLRLHERGMSNLDIATVLGIRGTPHASPTTVVQQFLYRANERRPVVTMEPQRSSIIDRVYFFNDQIVDDSDDSTCAACSHSHASRLPASGPRFCCTLSSELINLEIDDVDRENGGRDRDRGLSLQCAVVIDRSP